MHVLHAIHDFLPRHHAGSELYALRLARAQMERHDVTVLCADFNPSAEHGHVHWRMHEGVPVVEIINNWRCASFEETYRSRLIGDRIRHVLETLRPDIVHVHNLLNLSFELPAMAKALGIPVVATLHDYTLLCASGGQRVHKQDRHVCVDIETSRCARCFTQSVFYENTIFGSVVNSGVPGRAVGRMAVHARRLMPVLTARAAKAARHAGRLEVHASDIDARMAAARRIFEDVDLFVAPSPSLAREFERFGLSPDRLRVSDYGMGDWPARPERAPGRPLRIGLVGTLVWHKAAHVLVDALRSLPPDGYRATIFGSTHTFPHYAAGLRARARGLPIEFGGAFPPDRAPAVYAGIDVLVVPSLWPENSPLVIHEAFQAGVAVVGSRIGGIPDLIKNGVSGLLFESGSVADLARALRHLVDDPSRAAALAAAAPRVKTITEDAAAWDDAYAEIAPQMKKMNMTRQPTATVMTAPQLSVVLPTRNGADTLPRRLAAIVLNYRTPEDTFLATRSLLLSRRSIDHVIVVDNCDEDDSSSQQSHLDSSNRRANLDSSNRRANPDVSSRRALARRPCEEALSPLINRITYLPTGANLGFSGGMNIGIAHALDAGADTILLVNSDVVVPVDCVDALERALYETAGAGIAGPIVLGRRTPDRITSHGISYNETTGRMRHRSVGARLEESPEAAAVPMDAVSGCMMLVKREVFERVGAFDPDYFFSFEDLDFCLRARDAGYSSIVVPAATALHEGGRSMGTDVRLFYFGGRNHLWLARQRRGRAGRPHAAARSLYIVLLNVAHAFRAPGGSLAGRLLAVAQGTRDYWYGRLGSRT